VNPKIDFSPNTDPIGGFRLDSKWLSHIQDFSEAELFWLSGYCSGVLVGRGKNEAVKEQAIQYSGNLNSQDKAQSKLNLSAKTINVLILYGSQTGNAQSLAQRLEDFLVKNSNGDQTLRELTNSNNYQGNVKFTLQNSRDFVGKNLAQYQLIVLLVSTHGEGEPPDDIVDFHQFIQGKRAPVLDGKKFAIFSLGDSTYEYFCQTGKDFELFFSERGAEALIKRVDCDLDFEATFKQWRIELLQKLSSLLANQNEQEHLRLLATEEKSVRYEEGGADDTENAEQSVNRKNPFSAEVLENRKITARDSVKETHHLELSIEGSDISYQPGDGVAIWAINSVKTVAEILRLTGLAGSEMVVLNGENISVARALAEKLEITLLSKKVIQAYSDIIDIKDAPKLNNILKVEYSGYIKNHQVVDIISTVPCNISAQQLVDVLQPIKPRIYSIASSLSYNQDEIHLTVNLKNSRNSSAIRKGCASQFLIEDLRPGEKVRIYIEPNLRFRLPDDEVPIIMIGPGAGIAPFRSFLQQRDFNDSTGKNWLFFGNPNFNSDFLYQLELQKYRKRNLLTKLDLAFSRDQDEKIYVQDKLYENAEQIWRWINTDKAVVYVCGDMKNMAKDVHGTLLKIASEQGGMSEEQATFYLRKMKQEKRYQRDVY
jgi:sulfite reductase (NADPH) flavoprotein alpha-component